MNIEYYTITKETIIIKFESDLIEYEVPIMGSGYEHIVIENPLDNTQVIKLLDTIPMQSTGYQEAYAKNMEQVIERLADTTLSPEIEITQPLQLVKCNGKVVGYIQNRLKIEDNLQRLYYSKNPSILAYLIATLRLIEKYHQLGIVNTDQQLCNYNLLSSEIPEECFMALSDFGRYTITSDTSNQYKREYNKSICNIIKYFFGIFQYHIRQKDSDTFEKIVWLTELDKQIKTLEYFFKEDLTNDFHEEIETIVKKYITEDSIDIDKFINLVELIARKQNIL